MEEIWKDIDGYEWKYQISSLWRIKSINFKRTWKEIIMKTWKVSRYWHSWLRINLNGLYTNYIVSRLVWIHFIPNPDNLPLVCHKDETLDENGLLYNWADNLYWGTYSDNAKDRENKWRWNDYLKLNNPKPNLWKFWKECYNSRWIIQFDLSMNFVKEWDSIIDIERNLWIHHPNISKVCLQKRQTAGGFIWKYKN